MLIAWDQPPLPIELYVSQVFEALGGKFTTYKSSLLCPDSDTSYIFHLHMHSITIESKVVSCSLSQWNKKNMKNTTGYWAMAIEH